MVDSVSPKTISVKSALPWKLWKGKREVISIIGLGEVRVMVTPTVCGPVDFLWVFSRSYPVHIICSWIIEGVTLWSSVNYLFFISTSLIHRKNLPVRPGVVWLKDLKGVLGLAQVEDGGAGLKLDYSIQYSFAKVIRKGAFCWGQVSAKSSLQHHLYWAFFWYLFKVAEQTPRRSL